MKFLKKKRKEKRKLQHRAKLSTVLVIKETFNKSCLPSSLPSIHLSVIQGPKYLSLGRYAKDTKSSKFKVCKED